MSDRRRPSTPGHPGATHRSSSGSRQAGPAPSNGTPDPGFYHHLWRQTLVRLLLTYLAPVVLLAALFNVQYHRLGEESRRTHAIALAEARSNTLDLFLRERIANLVNVADDPRLPLPPPDRHLEGVLAKLRRDSEAFVDLGFFDAAGRQVSYAGPFPGLVGREYGDEAWFERLVVDGGPRYVITDMYLGFRQRPHFTIAVSRRTDDGTVVLRATLDPERMYRFVTESGVGPAQATLLVNAQGEYQMVGVPEVGGAAPDSLVPPRTPAVGFGGARLGGRRVEYAYCWLDVTDWALVVVPERSGSVALLSDAGMSVAALSVAVVLAVLSTILIRSRSVVRARRREDRARAELSDQLAHASRLASVGELAAGVAHEINNPLAIIAEEAGLMRDLLDPEFAETADPEEMVAHLDAIHEATFRARDITRKLLSFVRKGEVHPGLHDVGELLEDIVGGFLERELTASSIRFERSYAEGLPPVLVDRGQLEQVIVNLITNAVDAIDGPGEITVATALGADGVEIAVSDTGRGIPAAQIERIFMPFFTTKEVGKGTGLGLSVSYGLVRGMGGTIRVESQVGAGSTFTITLPAAANPSRNE